VRLRDKHICQNCSYQWFTEAGEEPRKTCPLCKSNRWHWTYYLCQPCDKGWLSPTKTERYCRYCKAPLGVTVRPDKIPTRVDRPQTNEEIILGAVDRNGAAVLRIAFQIRNAAGKYAGLQGEAVRVRLASSELVPQVVCGIRDYLKNFKPARV
jgi:hypothetical protein